jgi:hypothetical protein
MRSSLIIVLLTVTAVMAWAATVYCPLHGYAPCYDTGQVSPYGSGAHKYHCTCGDNVWVKK